MLRIILKRLRMALFFKPTGHYLLFWSRNCCLCELCGPLFLPVRTMILKIYLCFVIQCLFSRNVLFSILSSILSVVFSFLYWCHYARPNIFGFVNFIYLKSGWDLFQGLYKILLVTDAKRRLICWKCGHCTMSSRIQLYVSTNVYVDFNYSFLTCRIYDLVSIYSHTIKQINALF